MEFPHPFTQKVQDIILYSRRNFFRTEGAGDRDGFLVGIQEINAVLADPQMLLKISFDIGAQVVVQIVEHQVGYLLAGFVGQYCPSSLSCHHVDSPSCR